MDFTREEQIACKDAIIEESGDVMARFSDRLSRRLLASLERWDRRMDEIDESVVEEIIVSGFDAIDAQLASLQT